jgi:Glycosyl transferase 4-like domain
VPPCAKDRNAFVSHDATLLTLRFHCNKSMLERGDIVPTVEVDLPLIGRLLDQFAAREGVPVHGLEMPRRITPLRDLATTARLWRRLRKVRPDIVNAHTPKGGLLGILREQAGKRVQGPLSVVCQPWTVRNRTRARAIPTKSTSVPTAEAALGAGEDRPLLGPRQGAVGRGDRLSAAAISAVFHHI